MTSSEIRRQFLDYFAARGHRVIPSSSLIPHGDPTLLFTNAGMIQFKPFFLGQAKPPEPRATTAQKCFRTGDIEEVGSNHRSLTFFEMLGNFSFGDYFKDRAIAFAFELLTQGFGLPAERIWATVHADDDQAYDLWRRETSIPPERIRRFGDEYNFWAPGPTGPCGPNSEINFDWGREYGCGRPECGPNCEHCERFLEIWNLVFIQYDRDETGRRTPLERPGIDTGMGLERMTAVLNGKPDVFETDLFRPIVDHFGHRDTGGEHPELNAALRIVADHSRGATMLIADGVAPSNEGRGYVLRRLIRRGSLHVTNVSSEPLSSAVPVVARILGADYPEAKARASHIQETIRQEEDRFAATRRQGMERVHSYLQRGFLTPEETFFLHDTLGFPMELTVELARERGVAVDVQSVQALMDRQRAQSRRFSTFTAPSVASGTRFVGYDALAAQTQLADAYPVPEEPDQADVYFPETPFYAERGGQAADTGWLEWDGRRAQVLDVEAQGEAIRHRVGVAAAELPPPGQRVRLQVDAARRAALAGHHSATHLVHQAIREILGEQAVQAGSTVLPEYATFDFRFPRALTDTELAGVAELVNRRVRENLPRHVEEMPLEQAMATGAVALFDEKYGPSVRVVSFGEWSRELCGGTHVARSGEIGLVLLSPDRSIGAGVRRVELRAGAAAEARVRRYEQTVLRLADALKTAPEQLPAQVERLQAEVRRLQKELQQARQRLAAGRSAASDGVEQIGGIPVALGRVETDAPQQLRMFADAALDRLPGPGVAVMVGGQHLVVKVAAALVPRGFNAGKICQAAATAAGGRGGGRPELAEGGGLRPERVDAALAQARAAIQTMAGAA